MKVASFIARRYFLNRHSPNAVNIISGVSILGILVGTLALIVVLSAFNGLGKLVGEFYNTFDPDLKIAPRAGKYFEPSPGIAQKIEQIEGVVALSAVLEERALLNFRNREYIATLKGVDSNYTQVSRVREALPHGRYDLHRHGQTSGAVLGAGVAYFLGYGNRLFEDPVQVFVPRLGASSLDFNRAFTTEQIYPSGIFNVQPEFDEKYVLVSLGFLRKLLQQPEALSYWELALEPGVREAAVRERLRAILGHDFVIENRQEQQAVFMKVMKSESLFTFLVFALILSIASFTIMGSLSMMMLDKREHLRSLWAMGADIQLLRRIFFLEGLLIAGSGAVLGLLLGVALVWFQQHYGWIKLGQGYIVEAYPVVLKATDVLIVILTVAVLGGTSSWLTSQRLGRKMLRERNI